MSKAKSSDRYVVPNSNEGWDVVKETHQRASAHTKTRAEAIARAQEIVGHLGGGELRIQNRDGRFADSDTQGRGHESPARDRR